MPRRRVLGPRSYVAMLCAGIATLAASCSVGSDTSLEAGASEEVGGWCQHLNRLDEAEMRAAFDRAAAELSARGESLEAVWTRGEAFDSFMLAAYQNAGCTEPAVLDSGPGVLSSALHKQPAPNVYCGPNHGRASVFSLLAAVPSCLNEACRQHDACYATCSADTDGCVWNDGTEACDEEFWAATEACDDEGQAFSAFMVRSIARALDFIPRRPKCAERMQCPGEGPCQLSRSGPDCAQCLEAADPGAACYERACAPAEEGDDTCYLANCDAIGRCFGGY